MNYFEKIKNEPLKDKYLKVDLLKEDYLMDKEKGLEIYYAPFDYINKSASVVIVGITPGWSQMEKSFKTFISEVNNSSTYSIALRKVKTESSFAGSMRTNLIKMLDELGLNSKLNLLSCEELFNTDNELLHSTSALKYPVFKNGKNYTGSSPSPIENEFLWGQIEKNLVDELSYFEDKLIIPLGKNVNNILTKLESVNKLNSNCVLRGFPHPSGANGHRAKQFETNKVSMINKINTWKV